MAMPPPPKPSPAPQSADEALAAAEAAELAAARSREGHVDAWMRGQGKAYLDKLYATPGARAEVSIGDRGTIKPGVLTRLCELYTAAGWHRAVASADVLDDKGEVKRDDKGEPKADPRGIVLYLWP